MSLNDQIAMMDMIAFLAKPEVELYVDVEGGWVRWRRSDLPAPRRPRRVLRRRR